MAATSDVALPPVEDIAAGDGDTTMDAAEGRAQLEMMRAAYAATTTHKVSEVLTELVDKVAASEATTKPPSSLPGNSSVPPASSAETHGGDGGCTAVALTKIGVYPTVAAAKKALDSLIPQLHAKFRKEPLRVSVDRAMGPT